MSTSCLACCADLGRHRDDHHRLRALEVNFELCGVIAAARERRVIYYES